MAIADELVTLLGVKLTSDTMANLSKFKGGIDSVVSKLNRLALITTGLATAAGFFIKGVMDETRELQTLSEKSGLSTDTLQEWGYAAQQAGVNAKAIQNDLVNLNKTMSSPIPGQFNVNMAMLGVSVRDSNGALKDSGTLLEDIGDKLSGMSHQQAVQWGSKVGISDDTIVLLRKGSEGIAQLRKEAHDLGAIIPSESIQRAEDFRKSLGQLQAAFRGLSSQLAIAAMPALQRVTEIFTQWIVQNRAWIQIHTESFMIALVSAFEKVWGIIKRVLSVFQPLVDKFKDFTGGMTTTEHYMGLLQGAMVGLMVIFAPFIAKLALLGAAFYALSTAAEDVMYWLNGDESFIGAWVQYFLDSFPGIAKLLRVIADTAKDLFVGAFEVGASIVERLAGALGDVFGTVLSNLEEVAGPIADFISNFTERFPAITEAVKALAGVISSVLGVALDVIVAALKFISTLAKDIFGWLFDKFGKGLDIINSGLAALGFGKKKEGAPTVTEGSQQPLTKEDMTKYANMPWGEPAANAGTTLPSANGAPALARAHPSSGAPIVQNDNRTINQQISGSDAQQVANAVVAGIGATSYNTQSPGVHGPAVR